MSTAAESAASNGRAPGVSVVLACHDAAATLGRTLDCLRGTVFTDFEVVLVDDASSDGTADLLEDFARTWPRSTVVRLSENVGVARARNAALEVATGDHVWFVDADDAFAPDALGMLHSAAVETSADVVFGRALEVDARAGTSRVVDGLDRRAVLDLDEVCTAMAAGSLRGFLWSKLFRRGALPQDPFPAVRSQSDFLGVMAVLEEATTFATVPDVVYTYQRSTDSITTRGDLARQLLACRAAFEGLLERRGVVVPQQDLAWFSGVMTFLAGADSILRAPEGRRSMTPAEFRRAAGGSTPAALRAVARRDPRSAARLAVAMLHPGLYALLYRTARTAREALRART